jgi:hypothetical protein
VDAFFGRGLERSRSRFARWVFKVEAVELRGVDFFSIVTTSIVTEGDTADRDLQFSMSAQICHAKMPVLR